VAAYWRYAQEYYRLPDGRVSEELANIRDAIRPLKKLYGHSQAAKFGPLALKAVRKAMVDAGLCRTTINARVGRIKRLFKWAAGNEMIPAQTFHGLTAVEGLRAGRENVREPVRVRPVPDEHIQAVLPHVSAPIRAMIELQRLTGCRPGEVCRIKGAEIDRSGPVWVYRPPRHKTQARGGVRHIPIGPRAQAVLTPWLKDDPQAFVFSPIEAVAIRNAEKRKNRRSPMTPSQAKRTPKSNPIRTAGPCYGPRAYAHAIKRACAVVGVPHWNPNRLRHAAATEIRARFGLEAAQAVLGHAKPSTTLIYAERDLNRG
jgi:integrase